MAGIDDLNKAFRDFERYTGDGLPNAPTGAALPVGDPSSGVHKPKKSEIRDAFVTYFDDLQDIVDAGTQLSTPADNTVTAPKLNTAGMQAIRNAIFPGIGKIIHASEYGFVAGAGNNNVTAWNNCMAATAAGDVVFLPAGSYYFTAKPNAVPVGVSVVGSGRWHTSLFKDYTAALDVDLFIELAGANRVENLIIDTPSGRTLGTAIGNVATSGDGKGTIFLRNLYISGTGTFSYGWRHDGTLKSTGAIGTRQVYGESVQVFQATIANIAFVGVQQGSLSNCNAVPTPSDPSVADIYIDGSVGVPCQTVGIFGAQANHIRIDRGTGVVISTGVIKKITFSSTSSASTLVAGALSNLAGSTFTGTNNIAMVGGSLYCNGDFTIAQKNPAANFATFITNRGVETSDLLYMYADGLNYTAYWQVVNGTGYNTANAALKINKNVTTNRSINAAGTINASGAGFAEYVWKRDDCGEIAKGDVFGLDAGGYATDKWEYAVTFGVKSSGPAMTASGLRPWGTEEALGMKEPKRPQDGTEKQLAVYEKARAKFAAALEKQRQAVDLQEVAGYCPVNVEGKPGDWIVPVKGSRGKISARAVSDEKMTFEEWRRAVGQVTAIIDGRTIIRVGR